ncbi:MAG: hypothetical protein ACXAD7_14055 [Candidatus Kariarchaeaceae archaeon]|jgi:hypothetical protein
MSYFGAALGTAIGMMIGLVAYTNAWRMKSFLPKEYDFVHEWGKSFVKTDKKAYTYSARLLVGTLFHPIIFVFIWGREGLLQIDLYDNDVLSAVILLLVEATMFSLAIWFNIVKVPETLKLRIIYMQFVIHLIIGLLMGYGYTLL